MKYSRDLASVLGASRASFGPPPAQTAGGSYATPKPQGASIPSHDVPSQFGAFDRFKAQDKLLPVARDATPHAALLRKQLLALLRNGEGRFLYLGRQGDVRLSGHGNRPVPSAWVRRWLKGGLIVAKNTTDGVVYLAASVAPCS